MNSRERVQCVLNGRMPDRLPFNFWMDRDKMAEYDAKWGADFRLTHYGVDVIEAFVILPFWAGMPMKTLFDGKTTWQLEPLVESIKDAVDLPMPDPTDPAVLSDIERKRAENPDKAIFALTGCPFSILEPLRLAENLFYEVYDCADEIHEVMRKALPVFAEATRRVCASDIDVLYIAHDICGSNGPLLSPAHLREFHFDYLRQMIEIAHEAGKKVFYHSDGYIMPILDLYVEYGLDGCNPLEPRYNDAKEFADGWGDKLILYGGGDNCNVIPDGTPEEVRDHVRSRFDILGRNGRYIFSTHDIPSHCPQANLDAMVDEIEGCVYAEN